MEKIENEIVADTTGQENGVNEVDLLKGEIDRLKEENEKLRKVIDESELQNSLAVYERANWEDNLSSFLIAFPEANDLSKEIARELISSKDLAYTPNALERAYICVLKRNKPISELLNDEEFLQSHVYNCQKIKDKIIADYVSEIEKGAPSVISRGGEVFLTPPVKPRTLRDAMRLAEKYLS